MGAQISVKRCWLTPAEDVRMDFLCAINTLSLELYIAFKSKLIAKHCSAWQIILYINLSTWLLLVVLSYSFRKSDISSPEAYQHTAQLVIINGDNVGNREINIRVRRTGVEDGHLRAARWMGWVTHTHAWETLPRLSRHGLLALLSVLV